MYPAPLVPGMEIDPWKSAVWCLSCFGDRAQFATPHELARSIPEKPPRTDSLLHLAVARGDTDRAVALLDAGVPVDLLANDGQAPLHWSLFREDTAMIDLLLERGSPVDVQSDLGGTPLMHAVEARSLPKVTVLLERGAEPNAADHRGFTALHRAAERGEAEIVRLLLTRGAAPHPEAEGHTPRSLAETRGQQTIVELLDRQ